MKTKEELQDNLDRWIAAIPEKTKRLEALMPAAAFKRLDYSVESLGFLGRHICTTIPTINNLIGQPELWDCYASYVATTYKKHVSGAAWHVELDNEKNLYYGVPALRVGTKATFIPLYEVSATLARNRPNYLLELTKKHIALANE